MSELETLRTALKAAEARAERMAGLVREAHVAFSEGMRVGALRELGERIAAALRDAPAPPAPVATPDERSQAQIDKARTALAAERARADEAERLLAEARGEIAGLDRAAEAQVEALKAERAKSAAQVAAARAVRAVIEKHGHIDHHGHREPGRRTCGDDCAALDLIDTALAAGEA